MYEILLMVESTQMQIGCIGELNSKMKSTTDVKLTHMDEDDDTNEFMFIRCYMYRLKW
jgi:hypothetical protein